MKKAETETITLFVRVFKAHAGSFSPVLASLTNEYFTKGMFLESINIGSTTPMLKKKTLD